MADIGPSWSSSPRRTSPYRSTSPTPYQKVSFDSVRSFNSESSAPSNEGTPRRTGTRRVRGPRPISQVFSPEAVAASRALRFATGSSDSIETRHSPPKHSPSKPPPRPRRPFVATERGDSVESILEELAPEGSATPIARSPPLRRTTSPYADRSPPAFCTALRESPDLYSPDSAYASSSKSTPVSPPERSPSHQRGAWAPLKIAQRPRGSSGSADSASTTITPRATSETPPSISSSGTGASVHANRGHARTASGGRTMRAYSDNNDYAMEFVATRDDGTTTPRRSNTPRRHRSVLYGARPPPPPMRKASICAGSKSTARVAARVIPPSPGLKVNVSLSPTREEKPRPSASPVDSISTVTDASTPSEDTINQPYPPTPLRSRASPFSSSTEFEKIDTPKGSECGHWAGPPPGSNNPFAEHARLKNYSTGTLDLPPRTSYASVRSIQSKREIHLDTPPHTPPMYTLPRGAMPALVPGTTWPAIRGNLIAESPYDPEPSSPVSSQHDAAPPSPISPPRDSRSPSPSSPPQDSRSASPESAQDSRPASPVSEDDIDLSGTPLMSMTREALAPLNMFALASRASIASTWSAVPSTPGGPDVSPPTPGATYGAALAHQNSFRSVIARSDMARRAAMVAAAAAEAANGNTLHPMMACLQAQPKDGQPPIPTPLGVIPPDWDVTMWTRANVDGTL